MNTFIVLASLVACACAGAIGGYDAVDHMVHPTNYGHGLAASSRYDVRAQTVGIAKVAAAPIAYGGYAAAPALGYGGYGLGGLAVARPAIAAPALGLGYGGYGLGGVAVARPALGYGLGGVAVARPALGYGLGGVAVARPAIAGYGGLGAVSSYGYSAVHPARAVVAHAAPVGLGYGAYGAYHG